MFPLMAIESAQDTRKPIQGLEQRAQSNSDQQMSSGPSFGTEFEEVADNVDQTSATSSAKESDDPVVAVKMGVPAGKTVSILSNGTVLPGELPDGEGSAIESADTAKDALEASIDGALPKRVDGAQPDVGMGDLGSKVLVADPSNSPVIENRSALFASSQGIQVKGGDAAMTRDLSQAKTDLTAVTPGVQSAAQGIEPTKQTGTADVVSTIVTAATKTQKPADQMLNVTGQVTAPTDETASAPKVTVGKPDGVLPRGEGTSGVVVEGRVVSKERGALPNSDGSQSRIEPAKGLPARTEIPSQIPTKPASEGWASTELMARHAKQNGTARPELMASPQVSAQSPVPLQRVEVVAVPPATKTFAAMASNAPSSASPQLTTTMAQAVFQSSGFETKGRDTVNFSFQMDEGGLFRVGGDGAIQSVNSTSSVPLSQKLPAAHQPVHLQVASHLAAAVDGPVEVTLSPEELGRVRMMVTQSDGGVTIQFNAEKPETLDAMRRNIDDLAAELGDLGFSDMTFSFGQDTPEEHPNGQDPQTDDLGPADDVDARLPTHIVMGQDRLDIRL